MINHVMLPQYHFVYGLIVSLVMYFGFDVGILGCLVFLIATVGIDVDHYLYYVYRKRDWSLRRAVGWFMGKRDVMMKMSRKRRSGFYGGFYFLHGLEILLAVFLVGYFVWDLFYFVALGFLFHLILDWIDQILKIDRFDKYFVVWDWFKFRKLKFVDELEDIVSGKDKI